MALLRRPIRVRWRIFAFMFAFAMLSYVQRTSVAVAGEQIMPALHLSHFQISLLNVAFTLAYTFAQLPGGIVAQRFGGRWTYVGVGLVGLVAMLAIPLAPVLLTGVGLFIALLAAQAILGVSQGPVFPGFAGVLQAWFPANRWAIGNGLQTAGMDLGGAIAPLLIVILSAPFGWQGALLCLVVPAALLTGTWAWYGRDRPREHRSVGAEELAELGDSAHQAAPVLTAARLRAIVFDRDVLTLAISYLCMNYAFYLITFWSFQYLVEVRHFDGVESGFAGALPWIGAGVGAAVGGYLSDALAERLGARWGYRLVPLVTLPVAGILLLVTIQASTPYGAVAALTLAFAAVEVNEGAYWAATMRVAKADTAAATGVLNTGGNAGGIVTQPIVGLLSDAGAWGGAFVTGTVFALIAAGLWLLADPARRDATTPDSDAR
jgi:ACS family glucarate transporter-like MFS transporter